MDQSITRNAISDASSLSDLAAALRATRNLPADDQDNVNWTSLPTFGGTEPDDTREVWSWDADNLLVGTCADDLKIVPRDPQPNQE